MLSACGTTPPDPEETLDSLNAVAQPLAPPESASEYDATLHPDPLAKPLECTPYLLITARGTAEPKQKKQLLSPVVKAVQKAFADAVQFLDLDYPADPNINEGGTYGARLLIDTLNVQHEACPSQQFLLAGYSQGALVIGDALSAPELRLVGTTVGEVDDGAAAKVIAVLLYGNPRFSGQESYAKGDFSKTLGGILPRETDSLAAFADRTRDYCVRDDFVCQSSTDLDEKGHVAYFSNGMQQEGADFLIDRIRIAAAAPGSTAASPETAPDAGPEATPQPGDN